MLTRFGSRLKMYYLCISEEERAHKQAGFLLFFWSKTGCFTSEIEKNTSEIFLFLGEINFFLGQVVEYLTDVMRLKVNYSGGFLERQYPASCSQPGDIWENKNQDKPLEESGGFALVLGFRLGLIRASS